MAPPQPERRNWGILLRHFWGNSSGIDGHTYNNLRVDGRRSLRFNVGMAQGTVMLAVILLSGCAELEPLRISNSAPAPVVAVLKTPPAGAVRLGQVSETTCLNRFWDNRYGWDAALDYLKVKAAAMGADAVSDVRYQEGTVLLCPSSLMVSGIALRMPHP